MAKHSLVFGKPASLGAVPGKSTAAASKHGHSSFAMGGSSLQMLRKQYAKDVKPVEEVVAPLVSDRNTDGPDTVDSAAEWEEVDRRTAEFKALNVGVGVVKAPNNMYSKISYVEFESWLDRIKVDQKVQADMRWKEILGIVSAGAADQRGMHLVHCLCRASFDFNDVVHFRMLRTIYTTLTRNAVCGRIGNHWGIIGFQGQDPCTDLNRSNGLMNVIHMFFFHSRYPDIFKAIFLLSQNSSQEFPFACASINLTQTVIASLLDGRLTELCSNASESVFENICLVYCASFVHFYERWRTLRRSVEDFNEAKKEVCAMHPEVLLAEFDEFVKAHKERNNPEKFEFTDLQFGSTPLHTTEVTSGATSSQGEVVSTRYAVNDEAEEGTS